MTAILPAMFWASPAAWWAGTPMVSTTVKTTYNATARWITGLPLNTRVTNLLTLANLPPREDYLDYLSIRYAIRLHSYQNTTPWVPRAPTYQPTTTSPVYTAYTN